MTILKASVLRKQRGRMIGGSARRGWVVVCALSVVIGCREQGIEEHQVQKGVERSPGVKAGSQGTQEGESDTGGAGGSASDASARQPWVTPQEWILDPEPKPMRLATYRIDDGAAGTVEVAITRFSGRVGGELANINRWRQQAGLEPIDNAQLESAITRFEAPGFEGYEVRLDSDAGVLLAAGIYEAAHDRTWFVRATIPQNKVGRLAPQIFGVARSIAGLDADEGG